jgi:FAS-associated factor 2
LDRKLREDQDRAFKDSLKQDQEKLQQQEEKMFQANEEQLFESLNNEIQSMQEKDEQKAFERKRAEIPAEPAEGTPNTVQIMIRMPNGNRMSRRFHNKDTLQVNKQEKKLLIKGCL